MKSVKFYYEIGVCVYLRIDFMQPCVKEMVMLLVGLQQIPPFKKYISLKKKNVSSKA
jgi:hypothetical protein